MDPRHLQRVKIVQNLFAFSFPNMKDNLPYNDIDNMDKILESIPQVDALIHKSAPKFPIDRIAKTDLAILRLALYELLIDHSQPTKVVINEAVELAKEFGGNKSYAFINAVLGTIVKEKDEKSKGDVIPNEDPT